MAEEETTWILVRVVNGQVVEEREVKNADVLFRVTIYNEWINDMKCWNRWDILYLNDCNGEEFIEKVLELAEETETLSDYPLFISKIIEGILKAIPKYWIPESDQLRITYYDMDSDYLTFRLTIELKY